MKLKARASVVLALFAIVAVAKSAAGPAAGTRLSFRVLSVRAEVAPPFAAVDFIYGPDETVSTRLPQARKSGQWWQFEIRTNAEASTPPQCVVRAQTSTDPLAKGTKPRFYRYQLRVPGTGEALEYVDRRSGSALLPAWVDFEEQFIPHPAEASRRQDGAPETCRFLGQVLSLHGVSRDAPWTPWSELKRLELDREVLVGTGRNFKDAEGHRLSQNPQPRNYAYTNFTAADYRTMIEAGMNLFTIAPEQERWVRAEPVFYLRSAPGQPPLLFPADLYRANYLGPAMFMDEPAAILTWDKYAAGVLRRSSDAATLIEKRAQATFDSERPHYGRHWLQAQLRDSGVNLGNLKLAQVELPVWETYYDAAFYELKGGGSGIVHEGRYQLKEFDDWAAGILGERRQHTARQMLQWHYAFLRGAARSFGKFWGTAIYGQCDPALAPESLTTAYDMGARYFWFWTSDHGHHVPWPEQLALAGALKDYAREHPRRSIFEPPPKVDKVILMPNGRFGSYPDHAWLARADKEGTSEESQRQRRWMKRLLQAAEDCFRRGEDFDIAVDDGRPVKGCRRVGKLNERE